MVDSYPSSAGFGGFRGPCTPLSSWREAEASLQGRFIANSHFLQPSSVQLQLVYGVLGSLYAAIDRSFVIVSLTSFPPLRPRPGT
jgi:hypothetical protein